MNEGFSFASAATVSKMYFRNPGSSGQNRICAPVMLTVRVHGSAFSAAETRCPRMLWIRIPGRTALPASARLNFR